MRTQKLVVLGLVTFLGLGAWLTGANSVAAGNSRLNRGTDILHFFVRKDLTRADGENNAVGRVDIKQNAQGRANNQRLDLLVRHLEPNGVYHLLAWLGDDTNATYVAELSSGDAGELVVRYRQQANGNGQGHGRGRQPLPPVLDPVHQIRQLAVANASTQTVVSADITRPDHLHYLIKRGLTNEGVDLDADALLRIQANSHRARLRLWTIGLDPGTNYWLALNGEAWAPLATDSYGRARYDTVLEPANHVLDIHELAVWTSESNSVLRTTLP